MLQLPPACGELFCGSVCNLDMLDLCTYSFIVVASANAVATSSTAAAAASSASSGVAPAASVASFARFANVAITPAVLDCCDASACLLVPPCVL